MRSEGSEVADFRNGSFASVRPRADDFRSAPINRHRYRASACLKCANKRYRGGTKRSRGNTARRDTPAAGGRRFRGRLSRLVMLLVLILFWYHVPTATPDSGENDRPRYADEANEAAGL